MLMPTRLAPMLFCDVALSAFPMSVRVRKSHSATATTITIRS